MNIKERFEAIQTRIRRTCEKVNRAPESVSLVGVSKKQSVKAMQCFIDLCAANKTPCILGENYIQEFAEKRPQLTGEFEAHFIGHLQSNKVFDAGQLFECIQSVDSLKVATKISRQAVDNESVARVFLEINVSRDDEKYGFFEEDETIRQIFSLPGLAVGGLMTIPRYTDDDTETRGYFKKLVGLASTLRQELSLAKPLELSMGMSHDFEMAIEEGATMVRIGTLLFGER